LSIRVGSGRRFDQRAVGPDNGQRLFVIFHVPAARSAPSLTRGKVLRW
jgi:hypothetical protein